MELEERTAFEKVLKKMNENKKLYYENGYNSFSEDEKFSVTRLADLACNSYFVNYPELFDITEHQGRVIKAFFKNNKQNQYINELYKEFPGVFEGEEKRMIFSEEYLKKLDTNIPLFD